MCDDSHLRAFLDVVSPACEFTRDLRVLLLVFVAVHVDHEGARGAAFGASALRFHVGKRIIISRKNPCVSSVGFVAIFRLRPWSIFARIWCQLFLGCE